jgi:hypothetical protein
MMTSMDETGTVQAFRSNVLDLALEELQRLEGDRAVLQSKLDEVHEQTKAVKAVLRAVNPAPLKATKKKASGKGVPSEERLAQVLAVINEHPNEDITVRFLLEHVAMSDSGMNMVAKELRDRGQIRLVGRSGMGGAYTYRAMNSGD